ncbi:MAG TPA: nucleotidyl transferase AbiEii/AbiGii toxin family protein [Dongiaceae bacterium]|nr:nucleotidyl transferase AbiEii/AbiGii toxin family protein [Dongiaceae bacterium]
MTPHTSIFPPAQKEFWDTVADDVPAQFVLYGGTAIALRFGHRSSIDFDYFTDQGVSYDDFVGTFPLTKGTVLQRAANTIVISLHMPSGDVRVSFFGGISFGRVGDPERVDGKMTLAAPIDLLATKLKALHDRIEPKDYLDIEVLLKSGLTLNQGIAAAKSLFGRALNPLDTAKAVGWFKDGDLEGRLPDGTRKFLAAAAARFDPRVVPVPIRSRTLAPARQRKSGDRER